jgi:hypothetical protein
VHARGGRFDQEVILAEIAALRKADKKDLAKLVYCIERYQDVRPKEKPAPAMVESFNEGSWSCAMRTAPIRDGCFTMYPRSPRRPRSW